MSYTALYRKFRPLEFKDVKGQDAVVTTLKNQIEADRIGHAYLFCGIRGTGKTTIAKIFAKAVNCENPAEGSPCGECASCRAVSAGVSMNVIEIDAASNNGVDSIRKIREETSYPPTEGKYRVYIIDEVHMLSLGAFNALLKTLEEPPHYVIFILATTEVHKIPVTILSRCQRYDFKRIPLDTICSRLAELLEKEQIEAEEKAIRCIARAADGAMRDALSLLDQCIALYLRQKLTYDKVLDVIGAIDTEIFEKLLNCVLAGDAAGSMNVVERLVLEGRDLSQFTVDFIWYLRNLLLLKASEGKAEILDLSSENIATLQEEAKQIKEGTLVRYIWIFSELSNQMRYAVQKRILLEVALIKLCRPQMEQDLHSIADRLDQLEQKLEQNLTANPQRSAIAPKAIKEEAPPILPNAIPEDVKQAVRNWPKIISSMPEPFRLFLSKAKLTLGSGNELMLVFEDSLAFGFLGRDEREKEIEDAIANNIGKKVTVIIKAAEEGRPFEAAHADIKKVIHMEIACEE